MLEEGLVPRLAGIMMGCKEDEMLETIMKILCNICTEGKPKNAKGQKVYN